jgi:hypothetical protein
MPSQRKTLHGKSRLFDVRPDRYDVRDRKYQPKLVNLPAVYPAIEFADDLLPRYSKLVLDQGEEGACTGFGLAAMINYLRFRQAVFPTGSVVEDAPLPEKVSERMLYEHARLYDEWPGEDYDGSSCRGAMKGWHRHGVCLKTTWPYMQKGKTGKLDQPGKPKPKWAVEAAQIALGAYYRVETDDITAMQSALHEVGAVYCSANVHDGWDLKDVEDKVGNLSVMTWKPGREAASGHAFAIVGYNQRGFIVQNSWGPGWGYHGFALMLYGDWLENATDAWVATMGVPVMQDKVPTTFTTRALHRVSSSVSPGFAGAAPDSPTAPWSEDLARHHSVVLGNDGVLLRNSGAHSGSGFAQEVVFQKLRDWMKAGVKNRKVAIYAHGGLNHEEDGIKRVQIMAPYFMANGIYPIFVVWKTGWKESLRDMGVDALKKILPDSWLPSQARGIGDWLKEQVSDGADYTVETTLGFLGKSLWRQMKQNAEASGREGHGAAIFAKEISSLLGSYKTAEIHLLGHSAGAIWHGHFISTLSKIDKTATLASCHLFAPACTVPFANEHYARALNRGTLPGTKLHVSNLDNTAELEDNVAGFYGKSLLYFVSRACEEWHKTPILGMEAAWNSALDDKDIFQLINRKGQDEFGFMDAVQKWRNTVATKKVPAPMLKKSGETVHNGKKQNPPSHGGFDNDTLYITRTLNRILNQAEDTALPHPVVSLADF